MSVQPLDLCVHIEIIIFNQNCFAASHQTVCCVSFSLIKGDLQPSNHINPLYLWCRSIGVRSEKWGSSWLTEHSRLTAVPHMSSKYLQVC